MNKENCDGHDWCRKYSKPNEDLNCEDCDHYSSIDETMMRFEI